MCRWLDQLDARMDSINYPAERNGFGWEYYFGVNRGQPLNWTTDRGMGAHFNFPLAL